MTPQAFMRRARRALKKPPGEILRRIRLELRHELDRFTVPEAGRRFDVQKLLACTASNNLDELWDAVAARSSWTNGTRALDAASYETLCPGDTARILRAADAALAHEIDLLGSGPITLGADIDWHRDFCTGDRWPSVYFRSIDYVNKGRPSDVKRPWELSRLQWVIPMGQAFALTGDERYAAGARSVIESWIAGNPFACSVNWAVTMEPALRILSWSWLMSCCASSRAWQDSGFRERFLSSLYLHAVFTERFIERSDVNGNHFTADAVALVVAGCLFGTGEHAGRWFETGICELEAEILRQVYPDGVDFEASAAYHRLVAELFLIAAMTAAVHRRPVSQAFRGRLRNMAAFTACYLRSDGSAPSWGDADDARALPLGPQGISEHGYLVGLIGLFLDDATLSAAASGPRAEAAWLFGVEAAARLPIGAGALPSAAFPMGGVFIMRSKKDHVFIDCGRVGLADRGGHGHNDLLSFEVHLLGVPLIVDSGCYVYTADFVARNRFRSTSAHNTPQLDRQEINRFTSPDELWTLQADATPHLRKWTVDLQAVTFEGDHDGYCRLDDPVRVRRVIKLDVATSTLFWSDSFDSQGDHLVEIPLHIAPGVSAQVDDMSVVHLIAEQRQFELRWRGDGWSLRSESTSVAVSYGRRVPATRLVWHRNGRPGPIEFELGPSNRRAAPVAWT